METQYTLLITFFDVLYHLSNPLSLKEEYSFTVSFLWNFQVERMTCRETRNRYSVPFTGEERSQNAPWDRDPWDLGLEPHEL